MFDTRYTSLSASYSTDSGVWNPSISESGVLPSHATSVGVAEPAEPIAAEPAEPLGVIADPVVEDVVSAGFLLHAAASTTNARASFFMARSLNQMHQHPDSSR